MSVETGRQLDQLALTLGVVGPASRAEQTQKFVHEIVGTDEPQGGIPNSGMSWALF